MNTYKVLEAVLFATKAHAGQVRKFEQNEPYVSHVIRVAQTVKLNGGTEDMVVAALLHDVLEDCPDYKLFDIVSKFNVKVASMVNELTDLPKEAGNRAFRKKEDAWRLAAASDEAQTIKYADALDNIPSICENDPNFAKTFLREKAYLLSQMQGGNRCLWNEANTLVYHYAKKLKLENFWPMKEKK